MRESKFDARIDSKSQGAIPTSSICQNDKMWLLDYDR